MIDSIKPFTVSVSNDVLDDLRHRLERTRWAPDFANDDWKYGVNGAYLRELVNYWLTDYDWRYWEGRINSFSHFKTEIEGCPIHFIREPGRGPNPIPLILTHGWPWTFWDYNQLIRPLADPASFGGDPADAFDVIVPSLPGFGFSTPLDQPGMNYWRAADLWQKLMTEVLGFPRYAAQGGDWGALLSTQLSHKYAKSLYGIHITTIVPLTAFTNDRPWDLTGGQGLPDDMPADMRRAMLRLEQRAASHVTAHMLDPQTLAYGIHDSPVGLLAWILERRRAWADCGGDVERSFTRDHLLTTVMLYWVTQSFVTSVRFYAEANHNPWTPSHDRVPPYEAPAGISLMANDPVAIPDPRLLEAYNLHYQNHQPKGGHFAPAEVPEAIIADIRATFRDLRTRN